MRMLPIFALTLAACRGSIGDSLEDSETDPQGNPIGSGSASTATGGAPVDCTAPVPGASPIRRLTRFEYSNTVRDLLGDTTRAGDLLPPEQKGNGFSNDAASITTTRVLVDAYRSVAHDLAVRATGDLGGASGHGQPVRKATLVEIEARASEERQAPHRGRGRVPRLLSQSLEMPDPIAPPPEHPENGLE